jgi:hypothetical protein
MPIATDNYRGENLVGYIPPSFVEKLDENEAKPYIQMHNKQFRKSVQVKVL